MEKLVKYGNKSFFSHHANERRLTSKHVGHRQSLTSATVVTLETLLKLYRNIIFKDRKGVYSGLLHSKSLADPHVSVIYGAVFLIMQQIPAKIGIAHV